MNAVDDKGLSCLGAAGYSTELVNLLIAHGAKLESSAVVEALESGNSEALKVLLEAGVDPNARMPMADHLTTNKNEFAMAFGNIRLPAYQVTSLYYVASSSNFL